jgi:diguanylate cyclase (GGDEF)-like protein
MPTPPQSVFERTESSGPKPRLASPAPMPAPPPPVPSTSPGRRLPRTALALAVLSMVAVTAFLVPPIDGTRTGLVVDDLAEIVVAAAAAACAGWRARRHPVSARSWRWIALGCASWAIGEAVWSYFEIWQGVAVPFPSAADAGFLLLPVSTCVALLVYPAGGAAPRRTRRVLDALMTTSSLVLIAWETTLSAVLHAGADNPFALAVSLAYPVMDVVVLVLTVLTLSRVRHGTLPLWLTASALVALSISDSAFAYLAAAANYKGGAVDLGWFAGFVLLALAALAGSDDLARNPEGAAGVAAPAGRTLPSYLPYVPVVIALTVTLTLAVVGQAPSTGELLLQAAVVALLLGRQYLALRENTALSTSLAGREAELHHQAFHDGLTGLANRALFADRLTHALALHDRDLRPVAVLFLDLDDFKIVNDTLGHGAGDELLVRVAERVVGAVRYGDTVARLGGDEFAVLMEDGGDAALVADKLCGALRAPFQLGSEQVEARASIGVFALDGGETTISADELLARADTAMYAAKRAGKGQVALYGPGMVLLEATEHQLGFALAEALRDGRVRASYQPVIDIVSGAVRGLAALTHWDHDGEPVTTETTASVAERAGLLTEVTTHLLGQACADLASWSRMLDRSDLWVAVTLPPAEVAAAGFGSLVQSALRRHQLAPAQLVIELTQTDAFADPDVGRAAVTALRQQGVHVCLGGFGAGSSTLAQLGELPVDMVKVHRRLVNRLDTDGRQSTLLTALLPLAGELHVELIIDGVGRPEQLAALRAMRCSLVQGDLLHPALNPPAVLAVLRADRQDAPAY